MSAAARNAGAAARIAAGAAAVAAAAVVAAWFAGRVASDRFAWSQWLLWIPTPAAIAALLLAVALLAAARRRRAAIVAGALLVVLAAWFALGEHRFFGRPAPPAPGLRLVHWTISEALVQQRRDEIAEAVIEMDGDVTILTGGLHLVDDDRLAGWAGARPLFARPFTVVTRHEVRQLRTLVSSAGVAVVLLEIDAGPPFERPLRIHLVDLPSDPRAGRAEQARKARRMIEAAGEPAPDVVVGDLNATRGSASLAALLPGGRSAFDEGGAGYGATFPRRFPLYHIDHVLLGPAVGCPRYEIVDPGFGRHRAQSALIAPRRPPGGT